MGWLILTGYLAGWTYTARQVSKRMIDKEYREKIQRFSKGIERAEANRFATRPTSEDLEVDSEIRAMHIMLGLVLGAIWPLVIVGLAFMKSLPKTSHELAAENLKLQMRILELEEDNEVGDFGRNE